PRRPGPGWAAWVPSLEPPPRGECALARRGEPPAHDPVRGPPARRCVTRVPHPRDRLTRSTPRRTPVASATLRRQTPRRRAPQRPHEGFRAHQQDLPPPTLNVH